MQSLAAQALAQCKLDHKQQCNSFYLRVMAQRLFRRLAALPGRVDWALTISSCAMMLLQVRFDRMCVQRDCGVLVPNGLSSAGAGTVLCACSPALLAAEAVDPCGASHLLPYNEMQHLK